MTRCGHQGRPVGDRKHSDRAKRRSPSFLGAILQQALSDSALKSCDTKIQHFIHAQPGIETDPQALSRVLNWARSQFVYENEQSRAAVAQAATSPTGTLPLNWRAQHLRGSRLRADLRPGNWARCSSRTAQRPDVQWHILVTAPVNPTAHTSGNDLPDAEGYAGNGPGTGWAFPLTWRELSDADVFGSGFSAFRAAPQPKCRMPMCSGRRPRSYRRSATPTRSRDARCHRRTVLSGPYRPFIAQGLNKTGLLPPIDTLGDNLTKLGLPATPDASRANDISGRSAVASTLLPLGAGSRLAASASPMVSAVGDALTARPAIQAAARPGGRPGDRGDRRSRYRHGGEASARPLLLRGAGEWRACRSKEHPRLAASPSLMPGRRGSRSG